MPLRIVMVAKQRHPLHEELVEVRREDRQELGLFEERRALVHRFGKYAAVELEPAQIAIDPYGIERVAGRRHAGIGRQMGHGHDTSCRCERRVDARAPWFIRARDAEYREPM